jgi:hypothetical protein
MGEFIPLTRKTLFVNVKHTKRRKANKIESYPFSQHRRQDDRVLHQAQEPLTYAWKKGESMRGLACRQAGSNGPGFRASVGEMLLKGIFHGCVTCLAFFLSLEIDGITRTGNVTAAWGPTSSLQSRTSCLKVLLSLSMSNSVGVYFLGRFGLPSSRP